MPNFNGLWTSRQQMQARGGNTWPAVPGAPTSPVATAGNASASVAFTAPADTGYPAGAITGYRVTSTPGGFTGTGLTSPVTVSGLTNGTAYTFTVAAQNVSGYGPESVASNSVTPVLPNYIEEVFSTYLYTGNGATQTITNGINLSGLGGLVWGKSRSNAYDNFLADSVRGSSKLLYSNQTYAQQTDANVFTAFNSNGFSLGVGGAVSSNTNGATYVSWTFREQPKFFDVVTYTGNGLSSNVISHNLGSVPGFIICKRTDSTSGWAIWHRGNGTTSYGLFALNSTAAASANFSAAPTSTTFDAYNIWDTGNPANGGGATYVAYLFAHNAGGFGLTSSDNVISCGSFTTDASQNASVTLGYEPQWILCKSTSYADNWFIVDTMRGWTNNGGFKYLIPNSSSAELTYTGGKFPTATGFEINTGNPNSTYIYIAIRRGPMAVPTLGTSVFSTSISSSTTANINSGFVTDLAFTFDRSAGSSAPPYDRGVIDRLRGNFINLSTASTAAEVTNNTTVSFQQNNGIKLNGGGVYANGYVYEQFSRAPGFFDEVCYTGTGSAQNVTHNLTVAPELVIIKSRSNGGSGYGWVIGSSTLPSWGRYLQFTTDAVNGSNNAGPFNNTAPTSSVLTVNTWTETNGSGSTYVAYLFATVAGVSKVGSYTGTGATQTIACGFAAGARWVMIKRTDSTGDWYVWDSVRGMVVGTDPSLLLNTTAAEVNANSVYTITTGFQIVSTAAGINASGGTYIFLAIA